MADDLGLPEARQGFRFSQYRVSRRPRAIRTELRGACEGVRATAGSIVAGELSLAWQVAGSYEAGASASPTWARLRRGVNWCSAIESPKEWVRVG